MSIAALVPVAAVFTLAVPGEFGPAQVMLAAAGVTAWSMICMILSDRGIAFFTAATVVGAAVLAAGAVAEVWHLPIFTLGCGLVVAVPEGRRSRYELADTRIGHALNDLLGLVLAVDPACCPAAATEECC